MAEPVNLAAYRAALRLIKEREIAERWKGLRFFDLNVYEYFSVPPVFSYQPADLVLMKVEPHAACVCGFRSGGLSAFMHPGEEVRMRFDFPVVRHEKVEELPPE